MLRNTPQALGNRRGRATEDGPVFRGNGLQMRTARVIFLAIVLLAISLPAAAAEWTRCLGPTGGVVHQLTVCPADPATLLAASLDGLLKSTDAGSTWAFMDFALADTGRIPFVCLAYVPGERNHLYAGSLRSGLWKSKDGGQSWNLCLKWPGKDSRILCLVTDPDDPLYLLVGTSASGPFMSLDGGTSWRRPQGEWRHKGVSAMLPLMGEERPFLMGVWGEGLFLGDWTMESWEKVGAELPLGYVTVLRSAKLEDRLILGTYGRGLYQATAGELLFSPLGSDLSNQEITDLLVDPWNPAILYLSTDGAGVYHSSDGGQSWTSLSEGLNHRHVYCLATSLEWLYAGTCWGGIYRRPR